MDAQFRTLLVFLETAHVVSPFVLSWIHRDFRTVMLDRPLWYIVSPVAVFIIIFIFGLWVPFETLLSVYLVPNFWHFSMQNFGFLQWLRPMDRRISLPLAFVGTTLGMCVIPLWVQIHHWVTDIWMSQKASGERKWWFLLIIAVVAPVALCWNKAPWVVFNLSYPHFFMEIMKYFIAFRFALSFAHFTIEAKIWQFSDPQVRATIGRNLIRTHATPH